jgi:O-antigen ligase
MFPGYETAPLSVNPPTTVLLFFSVLGYLATFLLVRELAGRFSAKPWTLTIPLLIIGAFEAALGLFQAFAGPSAAIATGTYTNRDHFAGLLEMILPLALLYGVSLFRRRSGSAFRICALLLVTTLLALAIAYSLSRMGFLVMLAVSFVVAVLALRSKWRWPYAGLIGVAVLAAVLFLSPGQLVDRFVSIPVGDQTGGEIRLGMWRDTLRLIAEYPLLGCGLGTFESVYLKHQTVAANYSVAFAHNDYLQALAELGIIGFAILAAVLTAVVMPIFRRAWQMGQDDRRYLLIACCGAWIAIFLHSFVDFNMYIPANAMTLAWITGIGSAQASA